jgi:hypothetical protein
MRRISVLLAVALVCGLAASVSMTRADDSHAGVGPLFQAINPLTFDFVKVGTTSETRLVTVTNVGDATLSLSRVELGGRDQQDFHIAADRCTGASLAPNETCDVSMQFAPTVAGTRYAFLRFTDNSPCQDYINMAGSGTSTAAPTMARTATCQSGVVTKTVTNTTTTTLSPVSANSVITVTSKCSSRRTVDVGLAAPKGKTFKTVKFILRGKTIKTLSGKSIQTRISLKGLPRGRFTLQVKATTTDGKTYTRTHHYVTCVATKS